MQWIRTCQRFRTGLARAYHVLDHIQADTVFAAAVVLEG